MPFLVRDKNYHEEAARDIISNYRATFDLAKLDKVDDPKPDEKPNSGSQQDSHESGKQSGLGAALIAMSAEACNQELPILVGPGKVARIPFPMSEEDFDLFVGTLQLWKKKLVRKTEAPASNASPQDQI